MQNIQSSSPKLVIQEGFIHQESYSSYERLEASATNWNHDCTYQLVQNALQGEHKILQLHTCQLSFASRSGGTMNDVYSAYKCISIAVIEECEDKMCFSNIKLQKNTIVFFDDSKAYNLVTNKSVKFAVLTYPTKELKKIIPKIDNYLNSTIEDINLDFSNILRNTWDTYSQNDTKAQANDFKDSELKILKSLQNLLTQQTPIKTKLTKGETTALKIRDGAIQHMDGEVNIKLLAKKYQVSEQTLQNSFKSLFGFTPKYFLRQLKLNLVYCDLRFSQNDDDNVSIIANKWGFKHMGIFSKYYTKLFGENPSQTFLQACKERKTIQSSCVVRQEEIT